MLTRWVREAGLEKNKSFLGVGVLSSWILGAGVLSSWALINPAEHVGSGNVGTNQGEAQVAPPTSVFLNSRKTQLTYGKPNAGIQVAKSAGRGAALTDKYGNLI